MTTKDKRRFSDDGERKEGVADAPEFVYEVEPIHKWVLIQKIFREEKVVGGVVQVAGGRSQRGIVIAAAENIPLVPGQMVIYTNFPLGIEDLRELTGRKDLDLVRYEEVYAKVHKIEVQPQVQSPAQGSAIQ